MSMELMVKAMKATVGNPLRKLVLIKLADNANDNGECWPSYQHIADQCEIGRSTVKSHIRELEKMGFLVRIFRRDGELNKSNIFRLNLDANSGAGSDLVGQDLPEGGAGAAPGGGAGADPRTSHSFEPVIEPDSDQRAERVPYEEIFKAYATALPGLPQVRIKDAARKAAIRNRWNADPRFKSVEFWQKYFEYAGKSDFLMNQCKAIGFDWLMKPANFKKVLEGNYHGQ